MFVATYGTLRVGEGNWQWALRDKSDHVGTFIVRGFCMYSNGSFPYALTESGEIIVDLFEIDDAVLGVLDHLEGFPQHYQRKLIQVNDIEAWIYYTDRVEVKRICQKITSGDWLKRVENLRNAG